MGIKTVNLSNEAETILNKRWEIDPTFNFSEFVSTSLLLSSGTGKDGELEKETILKNLAEAEARVEIDNTQLKMWKTKLDLYEDHKKKKQEETEKAKQQEIDNEKSRIASLELRKKTILEVFKKETGKDMDEKEYREYEGLQAMKVPISIFDFCKILKEKKK